jgi:AI-2 transport protein TqsA
MDLPPPPLSARSVLARVRNPLWSAAALCIVVAGMKEAQSILVPIMVAVMMAIICSPAVRWLEQRRIPNALAVLTVVGLMMALLAGLGALVGGSVSSFRESIPSYQAKLAAMIQGLVAWLQAKGVDMETERLLAVVEPGAAAQKAMGFVGSFMGALGSALSNTVLVVLTMILILMEGSTVPAKLRALSGDPEGDITQYRRIATEVQSYLAIKTVLSLATGVIIGVWAAILDVDFALLWGLLAFLLNYIPNIGSILAAIPAMLLAVIQHGPGTSLALGAGYVVVNMVLGNVVEPMWMGRKLGLSTTVVFLSLVVWGWVWGSVGMLLSVPLTMVIKIMLGNSKEWSFVATLLDSGQAEEPDEPEESKRDSEPAQVSDRPAGSRAPITERSPAPESPAAGQAPPESGSPPSQPAPSGPGSSDAPAD